MGVWHQVLEYLYLKKRDPHAPHTKGIRLMNKANRLSLFVFLLAILIVIIKTLFFKRH